MVSRSLVVLVLSLPFSLSDWSYSQTDDLVLAFNHKSTNDSKLYKRILETLEDNPRTFNDTLCYSQFKRIFDGVKEKEKWALKVIDSWGHLPSPGLYSGRTTDLGIFDECLTSAHPLDENGNIFVGQYCLAQYPLDKIVSVELERHPNAFYDRENITQDTYLRGVCVPDSCSPETLDKIFKQMFFTETNKQIDIEVIEARMCTRNVPTKLEDIDIVALGILGVTGLLVILSTAYDAMADKDRKSALLISFSVITNSKKLFQTENKTKSSGSIECLNGIRFISMVWVVFGHLFMVLPYLPTINYLTVWEILEAKYSSPILNCSFAVDTFLLLSGFLIVYHTLKALKTGRNLTIGNILWMYLHRFVRLFPMLGVTVLFTLSIFRHIGDGPYWNILTSSMRLKCQHYWWSSLLYIQNFVNPFELCLTHTWYLSVDMQLYLLSPLLLIPLSKWGRKFFYVIFFLLLASISYIFTMSMVNDISGRVLETVTAAFDPNKPALYYSVPGRGGPWLVGTILGYIVHASNEKPSKWKKFGFLFGWICWGPLLAILMMGNYDAQQLYAVPDTVANSFYMAMSRTSWAILTAWVIFACQQGYGGFINSFLSFPIWQSLARLTYTIYLIHPFVQLTTVGEARINVYGSTTNGIRLFWGDFGVILTIAIALILLFESPIIALEKALLGGNKRKDNRNGNNAILHEQKDGRKMEPFD